MSSSTSSAASPSPRPSTRSSNVSVSPFGRVYQLVAVTLLFALNGHLLLLRGFIASFASFPCTRSASAVARPDGDVEHRHLLRRRRWRSPRPVLVVLFLAELALGLVNRAVPTLNVLVMSFPVKILLTLTLAGVAVAALPGVVDRILGHIVTGRRLGRPTASGGGAVADKSQKTEKPTPQAAQEGAGTGQIPRSADVTAWLTVLSFSFVGPMAVAAAARHLRPAHGRGSRRSSPTPGARPRPSEVLGPPRPAPRVSSRPVVLTAVGVAIVGGVAQGGLQDLVQALQAQVRAPQRRQGRQAAGSASTPRGCWPRRC